MEKDLRNLKTIIIGDSRAEGYGFSVKKYFNVLECCSYSSTRHQSITEFAENYLEKSKPQLLIMITLFEDITSTRLSNFSNTELIGSSDTFSADYTFENIKYYSDRWCLRFPNLIIVWTVPDIPDLVAYNKVKYTSIWDADIQWMRNEEKIIYKMLKEFREKFSSSSINKDKNFLVNLRMFIIDEEIEEKLLSLMTSHSHKSEKYYADGVIPNINLSEKFALQLLEVLKKKNIQPYKITDLKSEQPKDDLRYEGTLAGDIVQKLWKRHQRISADYIKNPQTYPGHDMAKGKFMEAKAKEMVLSGYYPSAEEVAKEWSSSWFNTMNKEMEESWLKKKLECLSMLNEDSFNIKPESSKSKGKSSSKVRSKSMSDQKSSKRKYQDIDDQAGPSSSVSSGLHDYLSSLLLSSQFLGKHYSIIKNMINESLDFKRKGLNDTVLLTPDSLRIFKEVKYELELAYSNTTSIAYHDYKNLKCNISTIHDLIEYCSFMIPSLYLHSAPASPPSNRSSHQNMNESALNRERRPIHSHSRSHVRSSNEKSKYLSHYTIEDLISKVGQYKNLSLTDQVELDQTIDNIRKRDKEFAVSLSVLKSQSFD